MGMAVENWTSVEILNMFQCRIMKIASLGHMQNLTELRLFDNNLTDFPDFGPGLPNLVVLELNKNQIKVLDVSNFKNLEKLEKLNLSNNQIEEFPSGLNCP